MDEHIGVVHYDLMAKGGGEAVAMAVLEALQDDYELTLVTLSEPDFEELNEFYNTDVEPVPVEIAGGLGPWLHDHYGIKFYVLQNALLGRYVRRHADEFDYLFSTINELSFGRDAAQYVHFPFDWTVSSNHRDEIFHPTIDDGGFYEHLCTRVARVERSDIQSNELLANSGWTADVVEDAYDTDATVVYPPVDVEPFDPASWTECESGFVTIGRIERSKRIVELIEVVDRVRERGHDVHLHVVGPTVDEEYYEEVAALAADRPHVELEGEVPREELVELVCTHRYGIHGKQFEHFGMAVAELVAGGCVTFVPAEGGQSEVIGDHEELRYHSVDDAVEKIDAVLDDGGPPERLRRDREEMRRRFGRERFRREVRQIVADALDRPAVTERSRMRAETSVD